MSVHELFTFFPKNLAFKVYFVSQIHAKIYMLVTDTIVHLML